LNYMNFLANIKQIILFVIFCAVAIYMANHPMVNSGMRRIQTDPKDTRFNNYLLEHSYKWAIRSELHRELWNPPFFYPEKNVLAYSDVLLGVAPFYWVWRTIGSPPDTAMQLWMMTMVIANFAIFFFFLRRFIKIGLLGSCFGSILFAVGNSRIEQIRHQQLLPHLYVMIFLISIWIIFTADKGADGWSLARRRRKLGIALLFTSVVLQFYTEVYYAVFLCFVSGMALIPTFVLKNVRKSLVSVLKKEYLFIVFGLIVSVIVLTPLLNHYYMAFLEFGQRPWAEVERMLPRPQSWLFMGKRNILYSSLAQYSIFNNIPMAHEHVICPGYITILAAFCGFLIKRRYVVVKILVFICIMTVILTTRWTEEIMLWKVFYEHIPGLSSIRAVSRMGILLLVPVSMGLAFLVDSQRERRVPILIILIAAFCVVEQANYSSSYSKSEYRGRVNGLVEVVSPSFSTFYLSGDVPSDDYTFSVVNLDAMWASLETGVPTINGYSGNVPPGYTLWRTQNADNFQRVIGALQLWCNQKGIDTGEVQLIVVKYTEARNE